MLVHRMFLRNKSKWLMHGSVGVGKRNKKWPSDSDNVVTPINIDEDDEYELFG